MKRYKLIISILAGILGILGVLYVILLFTPIGYQARFIVNVNKGEFEKAAKVISHVQDWDYNSHNETGWIDINQGLDFYEYLDSLNLCNSLCDSLLLYLADECNCEAKKYWKEETNYQTAESYLLQALEIKKFVLGEHNLNYATSLNNIGILYEELGNYNNAEQYFLQSLNIKYKIF